MFVQFSLCAQTPNLACFKALLNFLAVNITEVEEVEMSNYTHLPLLIKPKCIHIMVGMQ